MRQWNAICSDQKQSYFSRFSFSFSLSLSLSLSPFFVAFSFSLSQTQHTSGDRASLHLLFLHFLSFQAVTWTSSRLGATSIFHGHLPSSLCGNSFSLFFFLFSLFSSLSHRLHPPPSSSFSHSISMRRTRNITYTHTHRPRPRHSVNSAQVTLSEKC